MSENSIINCLLKNGEKMKKNKIVIHLYIMLENKK